MAQYTIEDVEILRQKSGISYEEAVNLLEYHNGSLARALVDLEKNGRIKETKSATHTPGGHKGRGVFNFLYRLRVKVCKGEITILNLSSLFLLFVVIAAPWVAVIGLVMTLVLGYRTSIERDSRDFSGDNLEDMVRNAGNNVRQTVSSIAHDLGGQPKSGDSASFYEQKPEQRTESAASGTTPVNVQFSEDGSVNVSEDSDGFHEADIQ